MDVIIKTLNASVSFVAVYVDSPSAEMTSKIQDCQRWCVECHD